LVPPSVLAAFGLPAHGTSLPGGTGRSIRHGNAVLKPVEDEDGASWAAQLLADLQLNGVRVPRPVRADDGRWVVGGWAAAEFLPGRTGPEGRWPELLAACRAFHAALRAVPRPDVLGRRRDLWARADRAAWGEAELRELPEIAPLARRLRSLLEPVAAPAQLVHGDLAGNILFAEGTVPAVLDFSPYWRPAAYADAIVAADGLLWYRAGRELLSLAATTDEFPQLLARAVLFRLLALNESAREGARDLQAELRPFVAAVRLTAAVCGR